MGWRRRLDTTFLVLVVFCLKDGLRSELVLQEHEGSNVKLLCHSAEGNSVSWQYRGTDSTSTDQYICIDGAILRDYRDRFTLTTDAQSRLHTLTIGRIRFNDTGVYTCIENEGLGTKHFLVLTVLPPVSTTSMPGAVDSDSLSENSCTSWRAMSVTILSVLCTFFIIFLLVAVAAFILYRRRLIPNYDDPSSRPSETKPFLQATTLNLPKDLQNQTKQIWICGLAILKNVLYVLRAETIESHTTSTDELSPLNTHVVNGLKKHYRNDMVADATNSCLYISDYSGKCVQRIKLPLPRDGPLDADPPFKMPDDVSPSGLSVTIRSTLLVTCFNARKLLELSFNADDKDSKLCLHTVNVVDMQSDIEWPMHAIEMPDGNYVVCHGGDGLWIIGSGGNIIRSYGDGMTRSLTPGCQHDGSRRPMAWPCHLAVDKNQAIIVADNYNDRLVLLSSELKYQQELKSVDGGSEIFRPRRLCMDIDKQKLYIGQYNGQLIILHMN